MNSEALLKQYVDTGLKIPKYQFDKLTANLKKTYLRKRFLAFKANHREDISYEMNYFPEDIQLKMVKVKYRLMDFIEYPSPKLQKELVYENPYIISHINNPTDYAQRRGLSGFVDDATLRNGTLDEVKKEAIQNSPSAIKHIYNPSEEMQLTAIQFRPNLIQYIKNPTPKVQMFLVTHHSDLFRMIFKPSIEAQRYMLDNHVNNILDGTPNLDITIQKRGVTRNPHFIVKIDKPSEEIQKLAIKGSPDSLMLIDDPTDDAEKLALELQPLLIMHMFSPSEEYQMIAVKSSPQAIFSISHFVPADSVQLYVAQNDPETYSHFVETYKAKRNYNDVYKDKVPSPSVLKYWEENKPLNENINRIKDLLK